MNITVSLAPALQALAASALQALQTNSATLARIEQKLDALTQQETNMAFNTTALTAATARETTLTQSVLTMVQGMAANEASLAQQLATAIAANDPGAIAAAQKAIDDSATAINASADAFATAVLANTPAAPAGA